MTRRWIHALAALGGPVRVAALLAIALPGAARAQQTQTVDLIGVTSATFEWTAAPGAVTAYLVFVAHDGLDFPPYAESFTPSDVRRITVQGAAGERLQVRVAALGPQLALGPFSQPSDEVRFLAAPPIAPPFDFQGDGVSELLLQDTATARLAVWTLLPAPSLRTFGTGGAPGALWDVIDSGDYDGDGKGDLLWRDPATGRLVLCRSDGQDASLCSEFTTLPPGWSAVGIGDTNGDGLRDVVLRGIGGAVTLVCLGTGTTLSSCGASIGSFPDPRWRLLAPGDVDGDGHADLVLHDTVGGGVFACPIVGLAAAPCNAVLTLGPAQVVTPIGDATGDGLGDLVVRDGAGTFTLVCSLAAARLQACAGLTGLGSRWQLVGAGDYDGDRRADLVLRDAAAGLVRIEYLAGLSSRGTPLYLPAGSGFRVLAQH